MTFKKSVAYAFSVAAVFAAPLAHAYDKAYVPAAKSAESVYIMQALYAGTESLHPLAVDYMKVVERPGVKVAYVEVHPEAGSDAPFAGWALLSNVNGQWKMTWAVNSLGKSNCMALASTYLNTLTVTDEIKADKAFLSDQFTAASITAVNDEFTSNSCQGSLIMGGREKRDY